MIDISTIRLATRAGRLCTLGQLATLFDLCLVVDGVRPAQARLLEPVIDRLDRTLSDADCTVGVLAVGVDAGDAVAMLGRLAQRVAVFADPDGTAAAALGVTAGPALVWVSTEPAVQAAVAGWDGATWRPVVAALGRKLAWARPLMPAPRDPDATVNGVKTGAVLAALGGPARRRRSTVRPGRRVRRPRPRRGPRFEQTRRSPLSHRSRVSVTESRWS